MCNFMILHNALICPPLKVKEWKGKNIFPLEIYEQEKYMSLQAIKADLAKINKKSA